MLLALLRVVAVSRRLASLHRAVAAVNRRYDGRMSIGVIVIPLVALVVCGAAMWLAWRIVRFADVADDVVVVKPAVDDEAAAQAARPSTTRRVGIAIAVLAMLVGLGGIAFVVWRALG